MLRVINAFIFLLFFTCNYPVDGNPKLTLKGLTKLSDLIVGGTIESTTSKVEDENGVKTINTYITMKVDICLKGNHLDSIIVIKTEVSMT